jgi:hypothetical protein
MSSLTGVFSSIASITTGSFASLTAPTTNAASTDDYTMCQDYDYKAMGIATDPYCNVTYGIPPDALNADPVTVAQDLISKGQIDDTTGDPIDGSNYAKFVDECINRDISKPLGKDGAGDGKGCIFGNSYPDDNGVPNNNYYIHFIDQRVQTGLDGEDVAQTAPTTPTPTPTPTTPTPTTPTPTPTTPVPDPPALSDTKLNDWIKNHANYNGGSAIAYKKDFRTFLQLMGGDVYINNLLKLHPKTMLNITNNLSNPNNYAETYMATGITNYRKSNWDSQPDRRVALLIHEYTHSMDDGSGASKYYTAEKANASLQWDPSGYPMTNQAEFIACGFEWVVRNDPYNATVTKRERLQSMDPDYYNYLVNTFIPWMYKAH